MSKFYVIKKKNKSGEGTHLEMRVNLGYADKVVSFEKVLIAEILGLTMKDLETAEVDKQWEVK